MGGLRDAGSAVALFTADAPGLCGFLGRFFDRKGADPLGGGGMALPPPLLEGAASLLATRTLGVFETARPWEITDFPDFSEFTSVLFCDLLGLTRPWGSITHEILWFGSIVLE